MLDAPDARTRGLSGTSQRIHATWIDAIGRTAVLLSGSDIASTIGSWPGSAAYHGTLNGTLLESVRLGVTTTTFPVVAPAGTVVVINDLDFTSKTAVVPLNVTLVAPFRSVPRILTAAPTLPEVVCGSTNGPRPTDRLKTLPSSTLIPPRSVVP